MKEKQDYIQDIAEIRSMMERSSKFMSLTGWAGIMAGIYAMAGAYIAYSIFHFNPDAIVYSPIDSATATSTFPKVMLLGLLVLILALTTAIVLSRQNAKKKGEKIWNATSRRLLANMSVPLFAGGILILVLISNGLLELIAPLTLLFYGLALYSAGNFTFNEVRILGLVQMALGLLSSWFVEYSLLLWAIGFGVVHIIYGIYMHFKYER